ncbi:MAG: hypothetical protein HZB56_00330 [Deltaproteobacteria bacterium]|nr:hypothetical protein [Deltaproteobacteria bacterium]
MAPPTVIQALRLSARAVAGSLWLAALALGLAAALAAAWLPVQLFPGAILARGVAASGHAPGEALEAGLAALLAPRALLTAAGLGLVALLLQGALRVLWLGGVLATLGEELSGRRWPAFASGAVRTYPRLLCTWLMGLLAEALALGTALGIGWSAVALAVRLEGRGGPLLALAGAGAATAAVMLPVAVGLLADAALARAALRGEGPLEAFGAALVRFGARPSAFLAVALAVGAAALVVGGSAQIAGQVVINLVAARLPPVLLVVPQLAFGAVGAMVGALFELWRLGAVAALACHLQPGEPWLSAPAARGSAPPRSAAPALPR